MRIRHATVIASLIFVVAQSAISQAPTVGWATVKSKDGVIFVDNRTDLHYTLALKGNDVKPLGSGEHIFLGVDGLVLQIQVAELRRFAPDARKNKLDNKAILAAHRNWELEFLEGLLKTKLTIQSTNWKLASGADGLGWQFDMPAALNAQAEKQLYLTTVSGDYVIMLNAIADKNNSEAKARQFLLDTIATLKINAGPIDVYKLAESLKKENQ